MKPHIKFHLDKDLFLAILVKHYWKPNSTYNVLPKWIYGNSKCTRHAYLRIDDTCRFCKIIWIFTCYCDMLKDYYPIELHLQC